MTYTFRAALCLLSLSLIGPTLAQSQAVSSSPSSSGVGEVAAGPARAGSKEEQERLPGVGKALANGEPPAALNARVAPLMQEGDYVEALRISQLAARLAESGGDRAALGNALHNMGLIYNRQNRAAQALDSLRKSLAVFEEAGDKRSAARGLHHVALVHRSQG